MSTSTNGRKTKDLGDGTEVPNEITSSDVIILIYFINFCRFFKKNKKIRGKTLICCLDQI